MLGTKKENPIIVIAYFVIFLELLLNGISNTIYYSMHQSVVNTVGKLTLCLRIVLVMLAVFYLYQQRLKRREIVLIAVFILLIGANYIMSRGWVLFDSFFIAAVFGKQMDYKKVLNIFFYTMIITALVTIAGYYLGVFGSYRFMRDNGVVRTTLGFNHPNTLGKIVMCLSMLYLLKREKKIDVIQFVVLIAASVWIYKVPNSLTAAGVLIITMIFKMFLDGKKISPANRRVNKVLMYAIPVGVIAVVYLMTQTGIGLQIVHAISDTFYSRFVYGNMALAKYGISLFGQPVEFANELIVQYYKTAQSYFTIDCFYIYMPVVLGIVPSIGFLVIYYLCIRKCKHDDNNTMLAILFAMLCYCVLESAITLFMFNFIFIGTAAYKKKNEIMEGYHESSSNNAYQIEE